MAIKAYRPTTPAQRQKTTQDFDQITTRKPLKSLVLSKNNKLVKTILAVSLSAIVVVVLNAIIVSLPTTFQQVSPLRLWKSSTIQTAAHVLPA